MGACSMFGKCLKTIPQVDSSLVSETGSMVPLGTIDSCASTKSHVIVTKGLIVLDFFILLIMLDNTLFPKYCNKCLLNMVAV